MKKFFSVFFAMIICGLFAGNPLPNPGFEEGEAGWRFKEDVSNVSMEASHTGKNGLRVKIDSGRPYGSSVFSSRLPVEPAQEISLSFWARADKSMLGVYLYYYDQYGKIIKSGGSRNSGGLPVVGVKDTNGEWQEYTLASVVPENAVAVEGWIHAYSRQVGTVDLDDFVFTGFKEGVKPMEVSKPKKNVSKQVVNKVLPKHPPVIILKLDDVTQRGASGSSGVSSRWQKLVDFLEKEQIKASLGIIGNSFEKENQAYYDWIKEQATKGYVEFWNHGYTHKELPRVNNQRRCEFTAPLEDQIETLRRTQLAAKKKTGIDLKAFGAPFNAVNADTARALQEFPEIDVWFFGRNTKNKDLLVLKRVINLEQPTMSPNSAGLISDYESRGKYESYLVLQGHPNGWNDERFNEFAKSVTYLKSKGCKFMTASEYYDLYKKHADK